jgi:hypothetical protein
MLALLSVLLKYDYELIKQKQNQKKQNNKKEEEKKEMSKI